MHKAALLSLLQKLDLPFQLYEHEAVMTVDESAHMHRSIPGMACKCLFLKGKDNTYWLVAVPAALRVNLKALQCQLGCERLSFASAKVMQELLGITPGAVTLFAVVNDQGKAVRIVMEQSLVKTDLFCFHPLVNTATLCITPQHMLRLFAYTGHEPVIVGDIEV